MHGERTLQESEVIDICDSDHSDTAETTNVADTTNINNENTANVSNVIQSSEIINMRKRHGQYEYLVKWTETNVTKWIPKMNLLQDHSQKIIAFYETAISWM